MDLFQSGWVWPVGQKGQVGVRTMIVVDDDGTILVQVPVPGEKTVDRRDEQVEAEHQPIVFDFAIGGRAIVAQAARRTHAEAGKGHARRVNACSVMELMLLGAATGTHLKIIAEGSSEKNVLRDLAALLETSQASASEVGVP